MALKELQVELNALMKTMYTEGILDRQFELIQTLQDESNPGFVADVIILFCEDSERILTELTALLNHTIVDYQQVAAYVHQLKGSSSCVGAQRMNSACVHFRQFYESSNKEGCIRALVMVNNEYRNLQNKFKTMLQLEQQIQAYEMRG